MAAESLMLINPRHRRAASPAQRAWRKKFGQMYGGRKHKRRYARNPIGEIDALAAANPRKHRHRNPIDALAAANPRRRHYRRNPRFSMAGPMGQVMDSAIGATGGVLLDVSMKMVPVAWKAGPVRYLVKGIGSVLLGMIAGMVKIPAAHKLAAGAMTVTMYEAAREYIATPMGLGEYTQSDMAEIGYYSPGQILEGPEKFPQDMDPSLMEGMHMPRHGHGMDDFSDVDFSGTDVDQ